jgi:hypothetical protein
MKTVAIIVRLLTFHSSAEELRAFDYHHLVVGLALTWLVGIGRWWEDPKANLPQHLGLGSVAYVFILAIFLWLVLWPLTPPHWSLKNVLIFITLTSPPALLYAIPVRHGLDLQTAQTVRSWLLAIVACWRVALLAFFLRRGAGLKGVRWPLATMFPLLMIVFTLTVLNLEKVVFDFMDGIRDSDRTVNDGAYITLISLSMFSLMAFLPLSAVYIVVSVSSVIEKYGRKLAFIFYVLALALVVLGGTLTVFDRTAVVWIVAGALMALTAVVKTGVGSQLSHGIGEEQLGKDREGR